MRENVSRFDFDDCQIFNYAVSDRDSGRTNFYVTNNEESSSLLKMDQHKVIYPHIVETDTIQVPTITIDSLMERENLDPYDMLNLDIQGAELLALKGATKMLRHTRSVYTEFNTAELYKGCALLPELDEFLKELGFSRKVTKYEHNTWGDALYIKDKV